MKNKIFALLLVLVLVLSGFYLVNKPKEIDGVKIYKNISNVKIDEDYVKKIKRLMNEKMMDSPQTALELADYFVKLNEKLYGETSLKTAYSYIIKSNMYSDLQIFDVAKESNEIAEELSKKVKNEKLTEAVKKNWISYFFNTHNYYDCINGLDNLRKDLIDDENRIVLDKTYSDSYFNIGDFSKAKLFLSKYKDEIIKFEGDDSVSEINYYYSYANLLSNKKDITYKDTVKYYDIIQQKLEKHFPPEADIVASSTAMISRYYRDTKEYNKVIEYLDKYAPEIYATKKYMPARIINEEYFEYYKDLKDTDKMLQYINKIEEFYKLYPENSIFRLSLYDKMTEYYKNVEELNGSQEAKNKKVETVVKAVKLLEPYKESDPILYAYKLKDFASKLGQEQNAQKREYYEEIFSIYEKFIPENSYLYANVYKEYANFLRNTGNNNLALDYYNKALAIFDKHIGKINKESAEIIANISNIYGAKNMKDQEINCLKNAINIFEQVYGKNSVLVYSKKLNLSFLYRNINPKKAKELFDSVLTAQEKGNIVGFDKNFLFDLYFQAALDNKIRNKETALEYVNKAKEYAIQGWQKEQLSELIDNINS